MKMTIICLLSACLALPACQRGARTSASPEETVKAERDSYQSLVQGRLKEFDHRFDGLEARMKGLPKADQERLKIDIAELKDRKDALQRKFNDLKGVSNDSWHDLKASMDRGLDQLEFAYNVVTANSDGRVMEPAKAR